MSQSMVTGQWLLLMVFISMTLLVGANDEHVEEDNGMKTGLKEDAATLSSRYLLSNVNGTLIPINSTLIGATLGIIGLVAIGGFLFLLFISFARGGSTSLFGPLFGSGYNNGGYNSAYNYNNAYQQTYAYEPYSKLGYKSRSSDSIDWESLNILDYISMMEEMWRKFDVRDVECQKRVLCELHQNEKALGPAATKVVNAIGYMRYLSLFNLPGDLRGLFEEYQDAADKGRSLKKDCGDIYDTCNFSFKETYMKYVGKNDKNALDN